MYTFWYNTSNIQIKNDKLGIKLCVDNENNYLLTKANIYK